MGAASSWHRTAHRLPCGVLSGRRIWLLASTGEDGVDATSGRHGPGGRHRCSSGGCYFVCRTSENTQLPEHLLSPQVGCVCFSGCKEYQSAAAFAADSGSHYVPAESIYAFNEGENARPAICNTILPLQDLPDAAVGDQRQAFGWQVQSVQALKGATFANHDENT